MEMAEFDLDRSVLRAWATFRARLADVLDGLTPDDILTIEATSTLADDAEGASPFIQVVVADSGLHAELPSNALLAEPVRLSDSAVAEAERIGWQPPTVEVVNFWVDTPAADCERLAAIIVATFRTVFSVPHPTFLDAAADNEALGISLDLPVVERPTSLERAEVQSLLDHVLTQHLGEPPTKDHDGDIPIRSGSALVFIRVLPDDGLIELKAPLVVDIEGRTRAAEVVADLNATWRRAKFVLVRDVVVVLIEVPSDPFVGEHLLDALRYLSRLADEVDDELADRLGGRLPFVEGSTSDGIEFSEGDDLAPELVSLMHLSGPGSDLTTDDVLSICSSDRDTILGLLSAATTRENGYRLGSEQARRLGQNTRAAEQEEQASLWGDVVDQLRAALRQLLTQRRDA